MECNRDEAERAKAIAGMKLQHNDFQGARKIALRAQKLYADLENISQMLMVCEVHCAAEKKLPTTEMDWYGILQLDRAANEAAIKKQYQKFALQLHPDKNKFPGAESAFKLVGAAHRVLLDQENRKMLEMKRNAPPSTSAYQAPMSGNSNQSNGVENNVRGNSSGFNLQYPKAPPPQAGFPDCHATIWTICPFCSVKYQYYRRVVNRKLCCGNCLKIFVAYDLNVSGVSPNINMDKPKFPDQDPFPNHGYPKVELGRKAAPIAEIGRPDVPDKMADQNAAPSAYNVKNRKRRRGDGGYSGGTDSKNSAELEEQEKFVNEDDHFRANQCSTHVGTSAQQRQKVSCQDSFSDADDDELVVLSERVKGSEQLSDKEEKRNSLQEEAAFEATRPGGDEKKVEKQKQNDGSGRDLETEGIDFSNNHDIVEGNVAAKGKSSQGDENVTQVSESETHSLPGSADGESIGILASDFHNFDDSKSKGNFQTGQVWALYSDEDCLPKNYCQIVKIIPNPQFKLHIRWLTRCMLPNDVTGRKNKDMLNSSGKFKLKKGKPSVYTATTAFSHQMKAAEHVEAGLFEIFPEKGDVWALHRCWNHEMSCSALESCSYDLVEVIKRNDSVVRVSVLEQVDGFISVFKCQLLGSLKVMLEIPMAEILRFSHQVPAVQLDEESNGSLQGCWDIDTAAMPVCFFRSK